MSSSFWLLGVELRDFSQAEKERTAGKAEQIHKMTTILTLGCHFAQLCKQFFLSQHEKNHVTQLPTARN